MGRLTTRLSLTIMLVICLATTEAEAACNYASITVSPTSVSAGTYTPPTAPPGVTRTLTLNLTYVGGSTGNCQGALAFNRAALSAALSRVGGGTTTIPYSLTSGGNSLIFVGATPTGTSYIAFSTNAGTSSTSVTVDLLMTPSASTLGGNYEDSLTATGFNRNGSNIVPGAVGTSAFTPTATVTTSCSIANANNISQVISVGSTGLTTGMQGAAPQFNVSCNSSSNVSLSSQNGAVTRGGLAEAALATVSGFRNRIEYQATINGGAGAVSLNTTNGGAAVTANGVFNAAAVTSQGTTVTITPESSTVPLLAGSYSDVLTVTITPQ